MSLRRHWQWLPSPPPLTKGLRPVPIGHGRVDDVSALCHECIGHVTGIKVCYACPHQSSDHGATMCCLHGWIRPHVNGRVCSVRRQPVSQRLVPSRCARLLPRSSSAGFAIWWTVACCDPSWLRDQFDGRSTTQRRRECDSLVRRVSVSWKQVRSSGKNSCPQVARSSTQAR